MKLIKYLTALLAMMILAVSCGKEKPDVKPVEKTPEIKVTQQADRLHSAFLPIWTGMSRMFRHG